ncbi:hypothetical protein BU24DRAFT_156139 [Aaosphaeria arxii CBS 175.79]|uniref:Uncharacterized protein n=1 Tax=Aaosphaeria arxii CBS 175.79 TaxID=1450172 RepID=A0A6A5XXJ6_9PLEO|nr:uncharacterized protein BU24DRAFT_156139 [Aaosphaeria arxii CBS 175.79]KAF2017676.1 hypothetical protein BU24DRAFT_156139 [Aaosphaeria arxii CBS 175.79]
MSLSARFDPLQLEDAEPYDEQLPDYEPATAPEYDGADYESPLYTYFLRQLDRRTQVFEPCGLGSGPAYQVSTRSNLQSLFNKKPEIEVTGTSQASICSIAFVNSGPYPWRPRARFSHMSSVGTTTFPMESLNFSDWTVCIEGLTFLWQLESRPMSLVLKEISAALIIARFTYSACGIDAACGAEIGDLTIFPDGLSVNLEGVERIICSLLVPIAHFRKMGKHYRNDEATRRNSWTIARLPPIVPRIAGYGQ